MDTFPLLKTRAVLQYPAEKTAGFSTQILKFVDGGEQRFREFSNPLRRWVILLSQLDDTETNQLQEFFRIQRGGAGVFTFTDPWDGTQYSNCSLETDSMVETMTGPLRSQTLLIVKENRN